MQHRGDSKRPRGEMNKEVEDEIKSCRITSKVYES
jgi:hypothetical protein